MFLNLLLYAYTGKRFKQPCASLTCDSEFLTVTDTIKYLGIHIVSDSQFTIDINQSKSRFYAALNSLHVVQVWELYELNGHSSAD